MSKHDSDYGYRYRLRNSWIGGAVLITAGVIFLLQNFFNIDVFGKMWPVLLIILGLGIILSQSRQQR